jgi:prepilin-type N-terminal cleavage/methylation domain-containing protein
VFSRKYPRIKGMFRQAHFSFSSRSAFTLIELLVVIAIIAILSVVVILSLNPAQLLMQSRDSNRLSDMASMNSVLGIYSAQGGSSFGSANTVYVSIPDPTATSTTGDQCQGLGLPSLPSTYSYRCAPSSTYRAVNGTGWIPVNLTTLAAGSPIGALPQDPINTSSSHLYYTYETNGNQYEVTTVIESQKYALGGSNDVVGPDGGTLTSVYEKGSITGLEPLDYGDPSLVGYWTFDEGQSSTAYDYSGNNATGSWSGTQAGTNGYYSAGKIGGWAGYFDGGTDYINVTSTTYIPFGSVARSVFAWVNLSGSTGEIVTVGSGCASGGVGMTDLVINSAVLSAGWCGTGGSVAATNSMSTSSWHLVGFTYVAPQLVLYFDGVQAGSNGGITPPNTPSGPVTIGRRGYLGTAYFPGLIDDVRIYNRALSAAQIAAMYNGGK